MKRLLLIVHVIAERMPKHRFNNIKTTGLCVCLGIIAKLRRIYYECHVCPSVLMEQLGFHLMDFMKFYISVFFENSVQKIQVYLNAKMTGTLHDDLRTFIISRSVLLRIINVSDNSSSENKNTF